MAVAISGMVMTPRPGTCGSSDPGTAAAVDFLASLGEAATRRARLEASYAMLHARHRELVERPWSGLREVAGVTVYGPLPGAPRTPTIAVIVRGMPSDDQVEGLAAS